MKKTTIIFLIIIGFLLTLKGAIAEESFKYNQTEGNLEIKSNDFICDGSLCIINFTIENKNKNNEKTFNGKILLQNDVKSIQVKQNVTVGFDVITSFFNKSIFNSTKGFNETKEIRNETKINITEQQLISLDLTSTSDSKYGKKATLKNLFTIPASSSRTFVVTLKTIFSSLLQKFDIDFLDPFISSTSYKAGTGQGGQSFVGDINTSSSEAVNISAEEITIGIDSLGGQPSTFFNETFENASLINYPNTPKCFLHTTGNGVNGTNALRIDGSGSVDGERGCMRTNTTYSPNRNPFNLTLLVNLSQVDGPSYLVGVKNGNALDGGFPLGVIRQILAPDCVAAGERICINGINTGLVINQTSQRTRILIEYLRNTTNGERTDMILWVNGTQASPIGSNIDISTLNFLLFRVSSPAAGDNMYVDNVEIYNSSSSVLVTNNTNNGYVRSNQFTSVDFVRRFAYNSSESGTADGLLINFSCDSGLVGTWSQTGNNNQTRQSESVFRLCNGSGKVFVWDTNVSQQQDLQELNISLKFNEDSNVRITGVNGTVKGSPVSINGTFFGDGDGDTLNFSVYANTNLTILNNTASNTTTNVANNSIFAHHIHTHDNTTVFWKVSFLDNFNDAVFINDTIQNFTVDTVTTYNTTRFFQMDFNRVARQGTQNSVRYLYTVGWNNTGGVTEFNQTYNISFNQNTSNLSVRRNSDGTIPPFTNLNSNNINFTTFNISSNTCDRYNITFNIENGFNISNATEICNGDNFAGNCTSRLYLTNKINLVITNVSVLMNATEFSRWSDRFNVSVVLINLTSVNETKQNITLLSDCQPSEKSSGGGDMGGFGFGDNSSVNGTNEGTFSNTEAGILIRSLTLGSSYELDISYNYLLGQPGAGGVSGATSGAAPPKDIIQIINITQKGPDCGNNICEIDGGEDILSCNLDCTFNFDDIITGKLFDQTRILSLLGLIFFGAMFVIIIQTNKNDKK